MSGTHGNGSGSGAAGYSYEPYYEGAPAVVSVQPEGQHQPVNGSGGSVDEKELAKKLTPWQAGLNVGKCCVGAGCFILPNAFKNSGIWAGVICLVLLGLLSTYTIKLLARSERIYLQTHQRIQQNEADQYQTLDNERSARLPTFFSMGWNILHPVAGVVAWFGIVLTILGVCGVYLDFIGSELESITDKYMTQQQFMLLSAIPLLFLSLFRSLKFLAFTSLLGDIAVTAGLFSVIIYGFVKHTPHSPFNELPAIQVDTLPKFFGSAVFLFTIHAVIIPISQSMREPTKFQQVANVSFGVIILLNALFGFFGYIIYGDDVKGLAIDNVTGPFGDGVKILLCLDLFFTVPIVMTAPRDLLDQAILPHVPRAWKTFGENSIRLGCVCVFTGLALLIPDINDLASLVGAFVSPIMGFILPPMFHLALNRHEPGQMWRVAHISIIVFGVFSCAYCTYIQVYDMVA